MPVARPIHSFSFMASGDGDQDNLPPIMDENTPPQANALMFFST